MVDKLIVNEPEPIGPGVIESASGGSTAVVQTHDDAYIRSIVTLDAFQSVSEALDTPGEKI